MAIVASGRCIARLWGLRGTSCQDRYRVAEMKRLIIAIALVVMGAAQAAVPGPAQIAAIYTLALSYANDGARPDQICATLSDATGYRFSVVQSFGAVDYQIVLFDNPWHAATFYFTIGTFSPK